MHEGREQQGLHTKARNWNCYTIDEAGDLRVGIGTVTTALSIADVLPRNIVPACSVALPETHLVRVKLGLTRARALAYKNGRRQFYVHRGIHGSAAKIAHVGDNALAGMYSNSTLDIMYPDCSVRRFLRKARIAEVPLSPDEQVLVRINDARERLCTLETIKQEINVFNDLIKVMGLQYTPTSIEHIVHFFRECVLPSRFRPRLNAALETVRHIADFRDVRFHFFGNARGRTHPIQQTWCTHRPYIARAASHASHR